MCDCLEAQNMCRTVKHEVYTTPPPFSFHRVGWGCGVADVNIVAKSLNLANLASRTFEPAPGVESLARDAV